MKLYALLHRFYYTSEIKTTRCPSCSVVKSQLLTNPTAHQDLGRKKCINKVVLENLLRPKIERVRAVQYDSFSPSKQ